jgi:hypothetical protein
MIMEEKRPGQAPDQAVDKPTNATAARTRPVDAGAEIHGDADGARTASVAADAEVAEMKARGFGSHKGTEAD